MIDGLALEESTPGPLIMIVAFIGFVGAYNGASLGPQTPLLAGVVAAVLVTWFTFLPSFAFILAGAPMVERTQRDLRLSAALTAITAAVVGVIAHLALYFASHVLWPGRAIDQTALLIAIAAAIALLAFKRGVIEVVAAGALIGLVISVAGG